MHEWKSTEVDITKQFYGRTWQRLVRLPINHIWVAVIKRFITIPNIFIANLKIWDDEKFLYKTQNKEQDENKFSFVNLIPSLILLGYFALIIILSGFKVVLLLTWLAVIVIFFLLIVIFQSIYYRLVQRFILGFIGFIILWGSFGLTIIINPEVHSIRSIIIISFLSSPIFGTIISFFTILTYFLSFQGKRKNDSIFDYSLALGFGAAFSILLTSLSIFLGNIFEPSEPLPLTSQMYFINIMFDGFSVFFTYVILKWLYVRNNYSYIIPAIILDLLLASVSAILSLYFGLLGSSLQLNIGEILNVLIGLSPDGGTITIGPYFWAMHTVFIPTLINCSILLLTIIIKMAIIPIASFFKKGSLHDKPLYLTAVFFAFLGGVFVLLGLIPNLTNL